MISHQLNPEGRAVAIWFKAVGTPDVSAEALIRKPSKGDRRVPGRFR